VIQSGNDQTAFYGAVPGYHTSLSSWQSSVSLISYRVNSANQLERMGKGLVWNAVSTTDTPVLFLPVPLASPLPVGELPSPTPNPLPTPAWPSAISATDWADSEVIGPQVFRFEYYYLLRNGRLSDIPWDTATHNVVNGMQDVSAIVVDIAAIDSKSKALLSDSTTPPQIAQVASQLIDWGDTACPGCPTQTQWQTTSGLLRAQWQNTLNGITNLPRPAISGVRLYERF